MNTRNISEQIALASDNKDFSSLNVLLEQVKADFPADKDFFVIFGYGYHYSNKPNNLITYFEENSDYGVNLTNLFNGFVKAAKAESIKQLRPCVDEFMKLDLSVMQKIYFIYQVLDVAHSKGQSVVLRAIETYK